MPKGSRNAVLNVIQTVTECQKLKTEYDGKSAMYGGHNKLILEDSFEAQVSDSVTAIGVSGI